MSVADFRAKVALATAVPVPRQRLIYRGKLLKDGVALAAYDLQDGHTVHLVAKPPANSATSSTTQTANEDARQREVNGPAWNLSNLRGAEGMGLGGLNGPRRQELAVDLEPITQGILTMRTRGPRQFFVGQWLDVKDTVNQWLESTVMAIADGKVLIHYHGWPTRWDEWIDVESDRIAAFRTRTLHTQNTQRMSPVPTTRVPSAPRVGDNDARESEVSEMAHLVAPLFDRFGRLLVDSAGYFDPLLRPELRGTSQRQQERHSTVLRRGHGGSTQRQAASVSASMEAQDNSLSIRDLIATSPNTASESNQPRRSIDVHIHAIVAPASLSSLASLTRGNSDTNNNESGSTRRVQTPSTPPIGRSFGFDDNRDEADHSRVPLLDGYRHRSHSSESNQQRRAVARELDDFLSDDFFGTSFGHEDDDSDDESNVSHSDAMQSTYRPPSPSGRISSPRTPQSEGSSQFSSSTIGVIPEVAAAEERLRARAAEGQRDEDGHSSDNGRTSSASVESSSSSSGFPTFLEVMRRTLSGVRNLVHSEPSSPTEETSNPVELVSGFSLPSSPSSSSISSSSSLSTPPMSPVFNPSNGNSMSRPRSPSDSSIDEELDLDEAPAYCSYQEGFRFRILVLAHFTLVGCLHLQAKGSQHLTRMQVEICLESPKKSIRKVDPPPSYELAQKMPNPTSRTSAEVAPLSAYRKRSSCTSGRVSIRDEDVESYADSFESDEEREKIGEGESRGGYRTGSLEVKQRMLKANGPTKSKVLPNVRKRERERQTLIYYDQHTYTVISRLRAVNKRLSHQLEQQNKLIATMAEEKKQHLMLIESFRTEVQMQKQALRALQPTTPKIHEALLPAVPKPPQLNSRVEKDENSRAKAPHSAVSPLRRPPSSPLKTPRIRTAAECQGRPCSGRQSQETNLEIYMAKLEKFEDERKDLQQRHAHQLANYSHELSRLERLLEKAHAAIQEKDNELRLHRTRQLYCTTPTRPSTASAANVVSCCKLNKFWYLWLTSQSRNSGAGSHVQKTTQRKWELDISGAGVKVYQRSAQKAAAGMTIHFGQGIVGLVAEAQEAINIPDAYDDPRFNSAWDQKTHYRTKTIENSQLFQRNQELCWNVGKLIADGDLVEAIVSLGTAAEQIIGVEGAAVYVVDPDTQELVTFHHKRRHRIALSEATYAGSLMEEAVRSQQLTIVNDMAKTGSFNAFVDSLNGISARNVLFAPLIVEEVEGIIPGMNRLVENADSEESLSMDSGQKMVGLLQLVNTTRRKTHFDQHDLFLSIVQSQSCSVLAAILEKQRMLRQKEQIALLLDASIIFDADTTAHLFVWEENTHPVDKMLERHMWSSKISPQAAAALAPHSSATNLHHQVTSMSFIPSLGAQSRKLSVVMDQTLRAPTSEGLLQQVLIRGSAVIVKQWIDEEDEEDSTSKPSSAARRERPKVDNYTMKGMRSDVRLGFTRHSVVACPVWSSYGQEIVGVLVLLFPKDHPAVAAGSRSEQLSTLPILTRRFQVHLALSRPRYGVDTCSKDAEYAGTVSTSPQSCSVPYTYVSRPSGIVLAACESLLKAFDARALSTVLHPIAASKLTVHSLYMGDEGHRWGFQISGATAHEMSCDHYVQWIGKHVALPVGCTEAQVFGKLRWTCRASTHGRR
ncbi:Ubiquitin-related domain [Phytophthora cactorum]|nr:Ubiquitin-related domain [Phytophthora cactorum]